MTLCVMDMSSENHGLRGQCGAIRIRVDFSFLAFFKHLLIMDVGGKAYRTSLGHGTWRASICSAPCV